MNDIVPILLSTIEKLEDTNQDLLAAIQVLLDGEFERSFTMPWKRYWNLLMSDVEVIKTDDTIGNEMTITIKQHR